MQPRNKKADRKGKKTNLASRRDVPGDCSRPPTFEAWLALYRRRLDRLRETPHSEPVSCETEQKSPKPRG